MPPPPGGVNPLPWAQRKEKEKPLTGLSFTERIAYEVRSDLTFGGSNNKHALPGKYLPDADEGDALLDFAQVQTVYHQLAQSRGGGPRWGVLGQPPPSDLQLGHRRYSSTVNWCHSQAPRVSLWSSHCISTSLNCAPGEPPSQ